ncbi:hypothetical protein LMG7053_05922 [Achromobacter ruhlandii]|uniref:Uncharacterized protein n=1 Tax=Achromobacter ruhlandii TaxID=72557 RepID=A0ABM8M4I9_9BURK|nr:hypothetical protein [Achromobacter ruhlandii]CAB3959433.1 hypothetical protein LMG7053_05922 [Achromobacter ruhlandii]
MENETPDPDEIFEERVLIRWGLAGFVVGLGLVYGLLYWLWQLGLSFFYPGA